MTGKEGGSQEIKPPYGKGMLQYHVLQDNKLCLKLKACNYSTRQATSERDEDQDLVIEKIGESSDDKSDSD